jgi:chromosome segregation ATPase
MRIDEQSRLIMILKERGDEYIRKSMALDEFNQHLLDEKEKYLQDIEDLNKKIKQLNRRFDDLAENHQEMIKIKDEYKTKNTTLVNENKRLNMKMGSFYEDQTVRESNLHENIESLTSKCKQYEETIHSLNAQIKVQDDRTSDKLREYNESIENLQNQLSNKDLAMNGL